jgi:hypothetical protein
MEKPMDESMGFVASIGLPKKLRLPAWHASGAPAW